MRTRDKLRDLRQYWQGKAEDVSIAGDAARAALVMLRELQRQAGGSGQWDDLGWWAADTLKEAANAWEGL